MKKIILTSLTSILSILALALLVNSHQNYFNTNSPDFLFSKHKILACGGSGDSGYSEPETDETANSDGD